MSNNATGWITTPPNEAYPRASREAHAEQHILYAAELGWLDKTSCTHIARTYGVPEIINHLKALKKGLFPEFVCGDGK